ncbi:unnamed protein product [Rotaria sp. Silwood2]|nr:unnamed protein product [Rotaria sp. Silwood2]
MNNLFDDTDKLVKLNRNKSKELEIKNVLNPFTRMFIDEQLAKDLGIILTTPKPDWNQMILSNFERNFYIESPIVQNRSMVKDIFNICIILENR